MLKKEHNVVFWEYGRNEREAIPVCEPTSIQGKKSSYNCILLDDRPTPNPRECRKLLKRGLSWTLLKPAVDGERDELINLFHHHIVVKDKRRIRNRVQNEYHFFFKKNSQVGVGTFASGSSYIADDRCIVLLKFLPPALKLTYLDLITGRTYTHKLVSLHTFISVELGNGSIWIIHTHFDSDILLIVPNRLYSNCIVMKGQLCINTPKPMVYFSSHCMVCKKPPGFLYYDEKNQRLVRKTIKLQNVEFEDFDQFYVFGGLFFGTVVKEEGAMSIFYHGVMEPEMQITRIVDLSHSLHQYQNYVQDSIEIYDVFHRPMKALVRSHESYILVLDLITGKVCQILSYIPCFWVHKLSIYYSLDGSLIKLIGIYEQKSTGQIEYLSVNFRAWQGNTLKDICKNAILRNFSYETLSSLNLPKNLQRELLSYFIYKDEVAKY